MSNTFTVPDYWPLALEASGLCDLYTKRESRTKNIHTNHRQTQTNSIKNSSTNSIHLVSLSLEQKYSIEKNWLEPRENFKY